MPTSRNPQNDADWADWRAEFPGLAENTYLNTVSLGQLSRRSRAAVNRFLDLWTTYGASAWYAYWLDEVAALRAEFAKLIGAGPDEIAIVPNVSTGLAAISSSLDFGKRDKVIACDLDFPTLTHHFLAQAGRGVSLEILPSEDQTSLPAEAFERAVDPRTAMIATSRVFFTSGYVQDVAALAEIAHRQGALLLVDDYQGTGQLPIDVKAAGVDILLTGGLKWLIGGPGVAYMYVRRDLIPRLTPAMTGWFAADRQFDFDALHFNPHPTAQRFEAGTPSVPSVYAGRAGLEIINIIGPENIRQRAQALNDDLAHRLREAGFRLRRPANPANRSAITIVETENPLEVVHRLADQRIIVDKRPGVVRVSPYFYNTYEENLVFIEALTAITSAG